jgi:hypothetical protein
VIRVGPQFLRRVVGQHHPSTPERAGSGGRRQIDEIDRLGGPTQFFLDDRPAPRQYPSLRQARMAGY